MENIVNMEKGIGNIEKAVGAAERGGEAGGGPARGACGPEGAAPEVPEAGALSADCRMAAAARILGILKERGLTPAWLGRKTGLSRQTVAYWLEGGRRPSAVSIEKAAMALGVSYSWLLTGRSGASGAAEGPGDGGDWVVGRSCVCEYEAALEGGAGRPALRKMEDGEDGFYRRGELSLRRLDPEKCRRIRARGDAMEPLIRDGDILLVDGSERGARVADGGVYCLDWGAGPRVRKLSATRDGGLVMKCLNPAYPDEAFTAEEAAGRVRIWGRVVERSGWI